LKKTIKIFVIVVALILVFGATVLGTLAFLTDEEEVINTFAAGKVDLTLDEAKTDLYGKKLDPEERVYENSYRMIPGLTYSKDPTVTVLEGSEAAYIRVLVTLHNATAVNKIMASSRHSLSKYSDWFVGIDSSAWTCLDSAPILNTADDTVTLEFWYANPVKGFDTAGNKTDVKLVPVFTGLKIPETLTSEEINLLHGDLNDLEGDFKITIVAHAIQAAGFNSQADAWRAFEQQMADVLAEANQNVNP
jgi:predicted ribosomally synthesized peptide with SipW-like signal peptide